MICLGCLRRGLIASDLYNIPCGSSTGNNYFIYFPVYISVDILGSLA